MEAANAAMAEAVHQHDTLTALRGEGSHLAAVVGESGKVIGFVTMEDVLSELVGPAAPAGA